MLFISYSREDKAFADKLYQHLISREFSCRKVFKDDGLRNGISLGSDWERDLLENIKGVTVLIVLVSPAWFDSKWCFAELTLCKTRPHNVRIIPFVIDDLTDSQWSSCGLSRQQRSNVIVGDYETDDDAIAAFVNDLEARGIRPITTPGRLIESYPDANSYLHKSYDQWTNDPNMRLPLIQDENQQRSIEEIRSKLSGDAESRLFHLHIHGNSGIGKTRVVFEALQDERFRSKVLYYENPDRYDEDPYIRHLVKRETYDEAILVVDDCLRCSPNDLAKRLAPAQGRVQIVTMSFDTPSQAGSNSLELQPLGRTGIQQILESYLEENDRNAEQLASMCQGSARYAHLLGQAAQSDRSILDVSDGRDLAERIIPCGAPRDSETAKCRLTVARFLALFERFGAAAPYEQELEEIVKIIRKFHPRIGLGDVADTVKALHQARILQGRSTYYFAVRLMAHELWCSWWSIYGEHWKRLEILDISNELFGTWCMQLKSVNESAASIYAANCIAGWLQRNSILRASYLSRGMLDPERQRHIRHQELLKSIFDLAPQKALTLLKDAYISNVAFNHHSTQSADQLRKFELEILQQAKESAPDMKAIELLWELERSEDIIIDGSTRISTLAHLLADKPTRKRSPEFYQAIHLFLKAKVENGSTDDKIAALFVIFQSIGHTQGKPDSGQDYLTKLWEIGINGLQTLARCQEAEVLFEQVAKCIIRILDNTDIAVNWPCNLQWIAKEPIEIRQVLLREIESIWTQYDRTQNQRAFVAIQQLYLELVGKGDAAQKELVFLTKPNVYDAEIESSLELLYPRKKMLSEICQQIIESPSTYAELLAQAVKSDQNMLDTGHCLAELDRNQEVFSSILNAHNANRFEQNITLMRGYLKSIREEDPEKCKRLAEDTLKSSLPSKSKLRICTFCHLEPSKIETYLAEAIRDESDDNLDFWYFIKSSVESLSEDGVLTAISHCIDRNSIPALELATRLFLKKFFVGDLSSPIAHEVLKRIIQSDLLFDGNVDIVVTNSLPNLWLQCFSLQLQTDSGVCIEVMRRFWDCVNSKPHGLKRSISSLANNSMEILAKNVPDDLWNAFFEKLNDSIERTQIKKLISWLSFDRKLNLWAEIPSDRLFAWAEEQRDVRLPMIASMLPPLIVGDAMVAVTREFLLLYGDHFPKLEHYWNRSRMGYSILSLEEVQSLLATAVALRDDQSDPNVITLLDREIRHLSQLQERTKEQEEIEGERLRY